MTTGITFTTAMRSRRDSIQTTDRTLLQIRTVTALPTSRSTKRAPIRKARIRHRARWVYPSPLATCLHSPTAERCDLHIHHIECWGYCREQGCAYGRAAGGRYSPISVRWSRFMHCDDNTHLQFWNTRWQHVLPSGDDRRYGCTDRAGRHNQHRHSVYNLV